MYGLNAISAQNGWAISVVGILIVFTGLTLLSIAISQLHKILELWDHRSEVGARIKARYAPAQPQAPAALPVFTLPQDVQETARQFKVLVDWIGEPFALPRLLQMAEKTGLLRPHAAINDLIQAGHIVAAGDGYYIWKP